MKGSTPCICCRSATARLDADAAAPRDPLRRSSPALLALGLTVSREAAVAMAPTSAAGIVAGAAVQLATGKDGAREQPRQAADTRPPGIDRVIPQRASQRMELFAELVFVTTRSSEEGERAAGPSPCPSPGRGGANAAGGSAVITAPPPAPSLPGPARMAFRAAVARACGVAPTAVLLEGARQVGDVCSLTRPNCP